MASTRLVTAPPAPFHKSQESEYPGGPEFPSGAPSRGRIVLSANQLGLSMSNYSSTPRFTDKQGQYLAFIHAYVLLNRRAPAEADMERYFGVTPPTVHRMVVELERRGLIRHLPRQARSIELTVATDELPTLHPQPIKTSVVGY